MPNWVTNTLTIYGKTEDVKAMFDRAKADKRNIFTMESFKPMPKTFYDTDTTNGVFVTERQFIEEYKKTNGCEPEGDVLESLKAKALKKWEAARKYQEEKYGCVGWYDWRRIHLGTKWDADLIGKDDLYNRIENESINGEITLSIVFDTAWSAPYEWLVTVLQNNPTIRVDMWCDEESGYKFYYVGAEGELSEDLSNDLMERFMEEAKNMDADEIVKLGKLDENGLMSKMLHNNTAKEYIIERLFGFGYWDRNGWLEAAYDFEVNQLEYILEDFTYSYLKENAPSKVEEILTKYNIVLSEEMRTRVAHNIDELINLFCQDEEEVYNACMCCEWYECFVKWMQNYKPEQDEEDDDDDVE